MELQTQALDIFNKLFSDSDEVKRFKTSKLRYVEDKTYRFVEQNPNTSSKYAKMAKEGHHIMWVINHVNNKYVAKVVDGIYSLA